MLLLVKMKYFPTSFQYKLKKCIIQREKSLILISLSINPTSVFVIMWSYGTKIAENIFVVGGGV